MTKCARDSCVEEGLVQFTEHTIYKDRVTYWLCEEHWREKFDQLNKPIPLSLPEIFYDYPEVKEEPNKLSDFFWNHPNTSVLLLFMIVGALFILCGWALGVY